MKISFSPLVREALEQAWDAAWWRRPDVSPLGESQSDDDLVLDFLRSKVKDPETMQVDDEWVRGESMNFGRATIVASQLIFELSIYPNIGELKRMVLSGGQWTPRSLR